MKVASLSSSIALAGLIAVVLLAALQIDDDAPAGTAAGARAARGAKAAIPRTPWGAPDLQGVWEGRSSTPLERPRELAGKAFLTEQEAAALDKQTREAENLDRREGKAGTGADVNRGYNEFWRERAAVVRARRTSLIVDPPDG